LYCTERLIVLHKKWNKHVTVSDYSIKKPHSYLWHIILILLEIIRGSGKQIILSYNKHGLRNSGRYKNLLN